MTYAWSVVCPLNDQGLVRPLVTAVGETVLMWDSGGEVWLRPSDIGAVAPAIPTAPDWLGEHGREVSRLTMSYPPDAVRGIGGGGHRVRN
jgi:hypothetical protein